MRFPFSFWSGGTPPLAHVDFSALPLGPMSAADFLAATGFTFERASASTVQTSANGIDSTGDVDDACIGDAGYGRGLVIQHNTKNLIGAIPGGNTPRDLSSAEWLAGSVGITVTPAYAAGPDGVTPGVGCTRIITSTDQYGPTGSFIDSRRRCFSSWQRSKDAASNGDMQQEWNSGGTVGDVDFTLRAASNTWGRLVMKSNGASGAYWTPVESYSTLPHGGVAATARDVLVDFCQFQEGNFATEAIPFAATVRDCDQLSYADASALIDAGQLRMYAKCEPLFATTDGICYHGSGSDGVSDYAYLASWDSGTGYIYCYRPTGILFAHVNGTSISGDAMTWAANDTVEFYVAVGAGIPTKFFYRVNGGSWTDLNPSDDVATDVAPSGAFNVFWSGGGLTGDSGQLPCRLQVATFGGIDPTV